MRCNLRSRVYTVGSTRHFKDRCAAPASFSSSHRSSAGILSVSTKLAVFTFRMTIPLMREVASSDACTRAEIVGNAG